MNRNQCTVGLLSCEGSFCLSLSTGGVAPTDSAASLRRVHTSACSSNEVQDVYLKVQRGMVTMRRVSLLRP